MLAMPPRHGFALGLLTAALVTAGCGGGGAGEPVGQTTEAIIGGTPSDGTQDAVVMLVFLDVPANRRGICTAALIAPRLVLTARHCVADTDENVACNVAGDAVNGGAVLAKHDPSKLFVFTGKNRPNLDPLAFKPSGKAMEVLDDGSNNLCNHDLALVLLEQPISGVPIASLRLDGDVVKDEILTTIGWGVTLEAVEPSLRQQRSGVLVTRVGPDKTDPVLTPNEFGFDESICLGDSGGPILAQSTGSIVGVVSRGGNGTSSQTDLASTCTKATNLGTKVSPFKDLITRGFTAAGAQPVLEVRPAAPPGSSGGCAVARGDSETTGFSASIVLLGLAFCRRSQRSKSGPSTRAWKTK